MAVRKDVVFTAKVAGELDKAIEDMKIEIDSLFYNGLFASVKTQNLMRRIEELVKQSHSVVGENEDEMDNGSEVG